MLVKDYLNHGVLSEKKLDDSRHVSLVVINNCDYILSWNFKHLVNIRTIDKIHGINKLLGYKDINIIPPPMLIEDDDLIYDANIEYIHKIRFEHYEKTKHMSIEKIIEQTNERAQKVIEKIEKIKNEIN